MSGAQQELRKSGWDGVLLGGNYVAGAWAVVEVFARCGPQPGPIRHPWFNAAAEPLLLPGGFTDTPVLLPAPLPTAGVALGKCIEYGFTFADQVASQLKKAAASSA